ncbi:MAG: DUF3592 domain-containing protein [Steroidobacteraceae bacterium]
MGARIIAYGFIGAFAIGSLVLLAIAVGSTVQRATLIFSGSRVEGTVVAKKQVGRLKGGAAAYAPMLQFTASDGRTYVVTSDLSGPESAYRFGQHLRVLYQPAHPDGARIDAFAPLWTLPLVTGVVGAAFSIVPAMVVVNWGRRRRAARSEALQVEPDRTTGRGLRWTLGIALTGGGLVLAGVGLGPLNFASDTSVEARVLGTSVGILLAASGVLVGQWVATGSRTYHALGGLVMTSMAVMFGWVAFFGQASGFSVGAGVGGAAVSSGGGVTAARIAFGIASVLTGFASLWAWRQVLRRHG